MSAEARPLIDHYKLQWQEGFFAPLPCLFYKGTVEGDGIDGVDCASEEPTELFVVVNGVQHDRDLIGCEPAAVTTMAAIEHLHPDIIVCSGTCGAWEKYGARVGEVCIGDGVMFHDRRVPGDNEWATQGLGNYPVWEGSASLAETLGLRMGKVTTGSSFDMCAEEEQVIDENGGRLKEMEGAAVGFVCSLFHVPVLFVKAVTNLRDAEEEDMEAFHQNLRKAAEALLETNKKVIKYLTKA